MVYGHKFDIYDILLISVNIFVDAGKFITL